MPAVKSSTHEFYQKIKNEYLKLVGITQDGVPIYSQDHVLRSVAKKFYRSPRTVENIIFNRV